jgi:hypothetical protein
MSAILLFHEDNNANYSGDHSQPTYNGFTVASAARQGASESGAGRTREDFLRDLRKIKKNPQEKSQ